MAEERPTTLTHIDAEGRARMVDVSDKAATAREAVAEGRLSMRPETLALALSGRQEGRCPRRGRDRRRHGRQTHRRPDPHVPSADAELGQGLGRGLNDGTGWASNARVRTTGPTGVEMEALTAVSVACLTLYDMLKAADRGMTIEGVRLVSKSGGKSGDWTRA